MGPDAAEIARQVEQGECKLWQFGKGEMYAVTRVEQWSTGQQTVIVALAGRRLLKHADALERWCLEQAGSVRAHITNARLMSYMKRRGYTATAVVMEKTANG